MTVSRLTLIGVRLLTVCTVVLCGVLLMIHMPSAFGSLEDGPTPLGASTQVEELGPTQLIGDAGDADDDEEDDGTTATTLGGASGSGAAAVSGTPGFTG